MRFFRVIIMLFGLLLTLQTAGLMIARRANPDSQMIALFSSEPPLGSYLYRVRPTGQSLRRLTDDPALLPAYPNWSPDGQWVVFTSAAWGDLRIGTMDAGGRDFRWLTTPPDWAWNPVWSPDGAWLLFLGRRDEVEDLYRIRADGSDEQQLTDDALIESEPIWSPDGQWVAFVVSDRATGENSLMLMRPDGSNRRMLHRQQFGPYALVWSWDSRSLYYSVRANGLSVIYRHDMTADQSALIHAGPPFFQSITPAPDGQSIAFITQNTLDLQFALWRLDLASRDVEQIGPFADNYGNLRYSPAGQWLMFIRRTPGQSLLLRMRPDGSEVQRITPLDLPVGGAEWQPIIKTAWNADGLLMIGVGLMGLAWAVGGHLGKF